MCGLAPFSLGPRPSKLPTIILRACGKFRRKGLAQGTPALAPQSRPSQSAKAPSPRESHSKNTPCTRSYADARAYGKHGIIADWNGIAL